VITKLNILVGRHTKDNGKVHNGTGTASWSGQINVATKANSSTTKYMVKVNFGIQTATYSKVNGLRTKHKVLAPTSTLMAPRIVACGGMICKMGKALRSGLMAPNSLDST
jgi:hypothetical protein